MTPFKVTNYIPVEPTDKQAYFLFLDAFEVFYGGAAGGGKSAALLIAALQYVDVPGYAALILRRTYKDLSLPGGLMDVAETWLGNTDATWRESSKTWTFPSGGKLTFGHMEHEGDERQYKSSEFQYIAFDELTEFTEPMYRFMFSRLRKKKNIPVSVRMRSASNPDGVGFNWVRKRMIVEGEARNIIFVPATFNDNPYLDQESYAESLSHVDTLTQSRLLYGNWDIHSSENVVCPERT